MSEIVSIIARLQSAISSRDVSEIRSQLNSARKALGETSGPHSGEGDWLNALIGEAEGAVAQASMTHGTGGIADMAANPATEAFDKAVSKNFSAEEKHYYEGFNPNSQYNIQARDENGRLKTNADGSPAIETVSGEKIRHAFATTKYNALSEEERRNVPDELKPKGTEKEQLGELKQSLNTLESRQAFELQANGRGQDVAALTEKFNMARQRIDSVESALDALEKNGKRAAEGGLTEGLDKAKEAALPILQQNLKQARQALSHSLQHDVLDDAMGLKKPGNAVERYTAADVDKPGYSHAPLNVAPGQSASLY
jgi:hypothetical protein